MIIKKRNEIKKENIEENKEEKVVEKAPTLDEELAQSSDLFNLDNIDFSQRKEKRRGERRRGYRRIDDRNLVSRAQEEAETIRANAQKEGYESGIQKANEDLETLRETLQGFIDAKQEIYQVLAPKILEISIDIAQKVVKKEIEQDPQVILNIIFEILDGLSIEEPKININVNPIEVDLLKAEVPDYLHGLGSEAKVNIIGDESLEVGDAVIHTLNGVIDATIPTQFDIIKEALKGV
ncbi:MAG: hypothetical protein DKM22_03295 [Candidatus Melainabacteria bacterium]|mgnify:FL=1|nr:MAG: hypothetical protein DKM22_03295 [Candidatus Melainabacteria bacterium]